MPALVVSLDFELFWGVTDSKTIDNYGANIEGVWHALPKILALFEKYNIHATWATVGMLMCKDYRQWSEMRPALIPTYKTENTSTYSVAALAREYPKLFFAPALVKQILETDNQELASHTYSHFCCGEETSTVEQFLADLACVDAIFAEYGTKPTSLVFPRNQVREQFFNVLANAGYTAYRGNQDHWLYRDGHFVKTTFSLAWRLLRAADNYLPLSGNHVFPVPLGQLKPKLLNIPASVFLRPILGRPYLDALQLHRVKKGMLAAAKTNNVFHLWWHPHNFGRNTDANLNNLEAILQYYRALQDDYGMQSLSMCELEKSCK